MAYVDRQTVEVVVLLGQAAEHFARANAAMDRGTFYPECVRAAQGCALVAEALLKEMLASGDAPEAEPDDEEPEADVG